MCGFVSQDDAREWANNTIGPEWAKVYSNGISDDCLNSARDRALADLDSKYYSCNTFGYNYLDCFYNETNELYDAYQGCLKLQEFQTNA